MTVCFDGSIKNFAFRYIIDKENNPINLIEFFEKYDHEQLLIQLLKRENEHEIKIEMINDIPEQFRIEIKNALQYDIDNETHYEMKYKTKLDRKSELNELKEIKHLKHLKEMKQSGKVKEQSKSGNEHSKKSMIVNLLNVSLMNYLLLECIGYKIFIS